MKFRVIVAREDGTVLDEILATDSFDDYEADDTLALVERNAWSPVETALREVMDREHNRQLDQ